MMNNDSLQYYLYLTTGLSLLSMIAEVVGFLVCLAFQHLSRWTSLVALGFAGLFAAGLLGYLPSLRGLLGDFTQGLQGPIWAAGAVIRLASKVAVAGGLWMTFLDVQRRLAMALEPKDGWR
jgi:hypothetical protein